MVFLASSRYVRGGECPVIDDDEKHLPGEQRSRGPGELDGYSNSSVAVPSHLHYRTPLYRYPNRIGIGA